MGCAEGYVTKCLSHISKTVVGVDVDIYYLKLARQKVPQASFINASLECLPFRNELFDAVVILEVLEHVPNNIQIKGLAEVSKVMKRNVPLLISVPYKETISYIQCAFPRIRPQHILVVIFTASMKGMSLAPSCNICPCLKKFICLIW